MKQNKNIILILSVVAILALAGCVEVGTAPGDADASNYPNKPITLIIPYNAGGGTDTQGRALAVVMEEELGQPINVVNAPGAGGTVGIQEMLAADPDGYTIAGSTTSAVILNPIVQGLDYSVANLAFAGTTGLFQSAIVASGDAPYDTWDEFVDYALENPGTKWYSIGQSMTVMMEQIAETEGIEMEIVPGTGGATILPALAAGDADISNSGGIHARYLESGEMKVLLNLNSTGPLMANPEAESGFERYGLSSDNAMVIVTSANVPADILSKLSAAVEVAAASDGYAEIMDTIKYPILFLNAEDSAAEYAAQEVRAIETFGGE